MRRTHSGSGGGGGDMHDGYRNVYLFVSGHASYLGGCVALLRVTEVIAISIP